MALTNSTQSFNLSIGQKELWFIHSLGGLAQSAYNESLIYSLHGYLSVSSLKKAFAALVHKHESLRTSFANDQEGNLIQKVHSSAPLDFTILEMPDERISEYAQEMISKPFDLKQPSLMRVAVLKKNDNDFLLIIVIHHIVTDGTSFAIFINDLSVFYKQIMHEEIPLQSQIQNRFYDQVSFEKRDHASAIYREQVNEAVEQLKGYSGLNFLTTPMKKDKLDLFLVIVFISR